MNALRDRRPLHFALRFVLAFGLLAFPWPHWQEAWRPVLRAIADHTLAGTSGSREVSVAILQPPVRGADIRFTVVNRDLLNRDGSGPLRELDLNVAQIEMRPMALLLALLLATPLSWKRRTAYGAAGAMLLQAGILAVLSVCIWRESMELLLVTASTGMKAFTSAVCNGLIQYSGMVLPLVIWLLFCFRGGRLGPWATIAPGTAIANLPRNQKPA